MEIYPVLLLRLLLASLIFGAMMGVLYDAIRIQRVLLGISRYTDAVKAPVFCPKFCPPKKKKTSGRASEGAKYICLVLQDVIFCFTVGALLAVLLFYQNNGEFRGFVLAGAAVGFLAYYFTIGKLVIWASEYVVFAVKTAVLYLVYYLTFPFIAAARFLGTRIGRLLERLRQKRREKACHRYHRKRYQEWLALSQRGFLESAWMESEK